MKMENPEDFSFTSSTTSVLGKRKRPQCERDANEAKLADEVSQETGSENGEADQSEAVQNKADPAKKRFKAAMEVVSQNKVIEEYKDSQLKAKVRYSVIWYQLETWMSPQSYEAHANITVEEFIDFLKFTFREEINSKDCNIQLHLQSRQIDQSKKDSAKTAHILFKSTINAPVTVSWPKAMKMIKEKILIKKIYPETARKKHLGTKKRVSISNK